MCTLPSLRLTTRKNSVCRTACWPAYLIVHSPSYPTWGACGQIACHFDHAVLCQITIPLTTCGFCSYQILIDGEEKKTGSLFEDFTPSINPDQEIDDPEDTKPDDWVDTAK
jgi:hypothetical protein